MASTPADKLAQKIGEVLADYQAAVDADLKETVKELGRAGVAALKAESRSAFNGKVYPTGWTATDTGNRVNPIVTLHNAKLPGLPHLLEHGHAKRGGGRVQGREHIKPVEDMLFDAAQKILEGKL